MILKEKLEADGTMDVDGLAESCLTEGVVTLGTHNGITVSLLECGDYLVDCPSDGSVTLVQGDDEDHHLYADIQAVISRDVEVSA